jgi:hypothetical protein
MSIVDFSHDNLFIHIHRRRLGELGFIKDVWCEHHTFRTLDFLSASDINGSTCPSLLRLTPNFGRGFVVADKIMSDCQFPSGQWFGFYTYASQPRRFLMDLILEFKNGSISGEGADGIGIFVIAGSYNTNNGECSWVKRYVGRHPVDYRGFREAKGIWGTWHITHTKGGFHIWPLSEGEPLIAAEVEEKSAQPATSIESAQKMTN